MEKTLAQKGGLADQAFQAARIMADSGMFVLVAEVTPGVNINVVHPMPHPDARDVVRLHLAQLFWWRGIKRYAFACESWAKAMNPGDARPAGQVRDMPGRREIIMVYETDGTTTDLYNAEGTRENGVITYSDELVKLAGGGEFGNIFSTLISDAAAIDVVVASLPAFRTTLEARCRASFGERDAVGIRVVDGDKIHTDGSERTH